MQGTCASSLRSVIDYCIKVTPMNLASKDLWPSVTSSHTEAKISHVNHFGQWDISKHNTSIGLESPCTVGFVILELFLLESNYYAVKKLKPEH